MRFVFDLDGVIRNLHKQVVGIIPPVWDYYTKDGKDIVQLIEENPYSLVDSQPTPYYSVIKKYAKEYPISIWTAQPEHWRKYTLKWIESHFSYAELNDVLWLMPEKKYELLNYPLQSDVILVEDYPRFPSYG